MHRTIGLFVVLAGFAASAACNSNCCPKPSPCASPCQSPCARPGMAPGYGSPSYGGGGYAMPQPGGPGYGSPGTYGQPAPSGGTSAPAPGGYGTQPGGYGTQPAPGGGTGAQPAPGTAPAPDGPNVVTVRDHTYVPATLTVRAGTTVRWVNRDQVAHSATGTGFDVEIPANGEGSYTFSQPGTYDVRCRYHPRMSGRVVVTP